jgi:alpha-galactosidase
MYVNENKSQAVVFAYKVDNYYSMPIPRIRLKGLDPDKTYTLTEKNVRAGQKPCDLSGKQFTGKFLMSVGIEIPLWEDYASRVFELKL